MEIYAKTVIDEYHGSTIDVRKVDMIDSIARAICSANCRARGLSPCWSIHTEREDAMEWPNPFCDKPGCSAVAEEVYREIEIDYD